MIHVERNALDENGHAIRPNDAWFTEAATATATAVAEAASHNSDDGVYAHTEVRKALERLFSDKCAYCEWKPTGGSDWDVEHYRPKGKVAESEEHPGYYWLAYDWSNLYMSCTHCNQSRKDKPRWAEPSELASAGKLDQFPLGDESTRAMSHDDNVDAEDALLLDPCFDDPEEFLGFDLSGSVFPIDDNIYGQESIRVFNLKRRRLKDLRRAKVTIAVVALTAMRGAASRGEIQAEADFRALLDILQANDHEFAAVSRYVERDPDAFGIV